MTFRLTGCFSPKGSERKNGTVLTVGPQALVATEESPPWRKTLRCAQSLSTREGRREVDGLPVSRVHGTLHPERNSAGEPLDRSPGPQSCVHPSKKPESQSEDDHPLPSGNRVQNGVARTHRPREGVGEPSTGRDEGGPLVSVRFSGHETRGVQVHLTDLWPQLTTPPPTSLTCKVTLLPFLSVLESR